MLVKEATGCVSLYHLHIAPKQAPIYFQILCSPTHIFLYLITRWMELCLLCFASSSKQSIQIKDKAIQGAIMTPCQVPTPSPCNMKSLFVRKVAQMPSKNIYQKCWYHRQQGSCGPHGAHLGPVGPRWAPCWPHESCYQGLLCKFNLLCSESSCHCLLPVWVNV